MSVALRGLSPHARARLIRVLEQDGLPWPPSAADLRAALGVTGEEGVLAALARMHRLGAAPAAAAAWIRDIDEGTRGGGPPELVWSGPPLPSQHSRRTREVFESLVRRAERSLLISSYAFYDGPNAFRVLARRMAAVPDLRVTLLLNLHRDRKATASPREQVLRFAHRFWRTEWPGHRGPAVFYDPRSVEDGPSAVLHAKVAIRDEQELFVTSANLTEAAFDRNYELGLLSRDAELARSAAADFHALIEHGKLRPLPQPHGERVHGERNRPG